MTRSAKVTVSIGQSFAGAEPAKAKAEIGEAGADASSALLGGPRLGKQFALTAR